MGVNEIILDRLQTGYGICIEIGEDEARQGANNTQSAGRPGRRVVISRTDMHQMAVIQ